MVFVSSDKDREDYDRLTEDMPWWRIDYDDYATLVSHLAAGVGRDDKFFPCSARLVIEHHSDGIVGSSEDTEVGSRRGKYAESATGW